MSSADTSSCRAAASISCRFSASAARSAALPTMNETRDEYEPLSLGVKRAVGGDDADARHRQQQHLGDDLRQQRRRTLADVGRAGEEGDAAVEVELEDHHRVRLAAPVHRLGRSRDIVRAGHAEAAPAPRDLRQPAAPLAPARCGFDGVQALRQAIGIDLQVVERAVRRRDEVGATHRERVEAEPLGHLVEQRFEGEAHVHRAVAAHGAARRQVGIDTIAAITHRTDAVQRMQQGAGIEDRHQAVAAIGAAALHDLGVHGGDLAVPAHADLQPRVRRRPAAVGEEGLLAREFELDGGPRGARQRRRHHLEIQRLDAVAEAAADEGLHDAHGRSCPAPASAPASGAGSRAPGSPSAP